MRTMIYLFAASVLAVSPAAQAEQAARETAKTEAPKTPVVTDKSAETAKPVVQTVIVEPRKSGLDQPLCTGE